MSDRETLVVISYYDRHPLENLTLLLDTLRRHPAGGGFDSLVVVNRTTQERVSLPERFRDVPVEYRPNLGMNIGAWDHGWRARPDYREYLFLQDECYAVRDHWLAGYRAACTRPGIGMVGESLNQGWNRPWSELDRTLAGASMPGHFIDGEPASRVECYLHFLREHGVDPGATGLHLRSLVWFLRVDVLRAIDGFLIGRNYGECIAAEIAASKKVQSLDLSITQVKPEEFFYFRHLEYNQDRPTAPFTHHANPARPHRGRGFRDKVRDWFGSGRLRTAK